MSISFPGQRRPSGGASTAGGVVLMHPTATRVMDGPSGRRILEGLAPYGAGYDGLVSVLADACAPASALELRGESAALEAFHAAASRRVRAAAGPMRHRRRRGPTARWSLGEFAAAMTGTGRPPVPARRAAPEVSVGPVIGSVLATAACAALAAFVYTVNAGTTPAGGHRVVHSPGVSARRESAAPPQAPAVGGVRPARSGHTPAAGESQQGGGPSSVPTPGAGIAGAAGTPGAEAAGESMDPVATSPSSTESPADPGGQDATAGAGHDSSPGSQTAPAGHGGGASATATATQPAGGGPGSVEAKGKDKGKDKGKAPRRVPGRGNATVPAPGSLPASSTKNAPGATEGGADPAGAASQDVTAAGHGRMLPVGTPPLTSSSIDECLAWQVLRGPFRVPVPVVAMSLPGIAALATGRDAEQVDLLCSTLLQTP